MNPKTAIALFCLPLFSASVSCSALKKNKETEPPLPSLQTPAIVGRIASIPADKRFVLIQSYGTWNVPTGAILTTRGPDERSANLLTTGEKLGQFAAADLQSGTVEVGDGVFFLPKKIDLDPEPSAEATENQITDPTPENVQKNN